MKKIILMFFVLIFVFSIFSFSSKAQDGSGEAGANIIIGLIEDQLIQEAAQEISNILKDLRAAAKEVAATKNVNPLISALQRNTDALLKAAQQLPPERCARKITLENIQKSTRIVNKFQDQLCSNVNARIGVYENDLYRQGMCAKFINNPVKFQNCEAAEHGGGKGGGTMAGGGAVGGSAMGGIGAGGQEKLNCLSDEEFAALFNSLATLYQSGAEEWVADDDKNGIPNACENNKKLMKRMHGGKKKPKKPKHGMY